MDDTLLGADGEFPEINVRALRACAERGIHLALNSGRSFETLREFACALERGALHHLRQRRARGRGAGRPHAFGARL